MKITKTHLFNSLSSYSKLDFLCCILIQKTLKANFRLIILWLILAWFNTSFHSYAQQEPQLENIYIKIDSKESLGKISDDFIGFGYETSAVAHKGLFSTENKYMIELYKNLSSNGMIRVGGIIGDWTHYKTDETPIGRPKDNTTIINRKVLEDLGDFLRATNWKVMWTLNLGTGTKEEAVEVALVLNEVLGDRLHSFEIGNEVDLLKRFTDYDEYHKTYLEWKMAIRNVLPNSNFSGADVASNGRIEWSLNFAKTEAKDMSLLIHHYYRGGSGWEDATIKTLMEPHPISDERFGKLRDVAKEKNIQFRINEMNTFTGGGKAGVSDSFGAALWCLDNMFRLATYGASGVNIQTDVNQLGFISHYSPIFRKNNTLSVRPEYYGMLAFSLSGKGNLLHVTTSNHGANINTYATKHSNNYIWITIINKDLLTNTEIELTLPKGYTTAEVYRLEAPEIASLDNVTLAKTKVSDDGTWQKRSSEKLAISKNSTILFVPASSAVLVRLKMN